MDNFKALAKEKYQKDFRNKLNRFEREAIIKTLRECKYDIEEGGKWLGYSAKNLRLRMKELGISITTNGRKDIKIKQLSWFNKYDRAVLNDLVVTWQNSCSDKYNDCERCPKKKEICQDITYKLIDRIYDKTGK